LGGNFDNHIDPQEGFLVSFILISIS